MRIDLYEILYRDTNPNQQLYSCSKEILSVLSDSCEKFNERWPTHTHIQAKLLEIDVDYLNRLIINCFNTAESKLTFVRDLSAYQSIIDVSLKINQTSVANYFNLQALTLFLKQCRGHYSHTKPLEPEPNRFDRSLNKLELREKLCQMIKLCKFCYMNFDVHLRKFTTKEDLGQSIDFILETYAQATYFLLSNPSLRDSILEGAKETILSKESIDDINRWTPETLPSVFNDIVSTTRRIR